MDQCKYRNSVSNKKCRRCGFDIRKSKDKIYWIEFRAYGRRIRERIGPSKLAAETRLFEIKKQINEGNYVNTNKNSSVTLQKLYDWYIQHSKVQENRSYSIKLIQLKNVLRILGKDTKISALSLDTAENYINTRKQEKPANSKQGVSNSTINKEIAVLRHMLNLGVEHNKISSNPIAGVGKLEENNIRERVLTDLEFETLLDSLPDYLKPIVLTAFYEPMRRSEIIDLQWSEVDLLTHPGFIRLSGRRTKNGEPRSIPLHPRVKITLTELPSRFKGGYVFLRDGNPIRNFRNAFNRSLKAAGIQDFHFHDLRHCATTNLRRAGNDYGTIMKAGGWKTMSMFDRYNLIDETDLARMKWKEESQDIESQLKSAGFDPEQVFNALLKNRKDKAKKMG